MTRNLADLRFAVRDSAGYVSDTWRLWATRKGDVYLSTRFMAKIEKYSFHRSGICRSAFTAEQGVPRTMTDRAMFKWKRLPTPSAGHGKASRVVWMAFPSDFLSRKVDVLSDITWVDAAPSGGATYVEVAFTHESQERIQSAFSGRQRKLLFYASLPDGEAIFVNYYHSDWQNEDLSVPGDGRVADLLFSASDPYDTGRPIRIRFGPMPVDGDALILRELGGYPVPGTPATT